ncbi:MAG: helix-turn-helix transcriptional regulator [Clostridia bacterium]|nr:helix-turn-helix transcriptional regulator [Clostridia bacterium]
MERKYFKHGNHTPDNDKDGYMYNFNTSGSYNFNSHLHSCYEFLHIIHGHLLYTVEGSEYILDDGDFIMTNPSELHSFSFPDEGDYQREFLHIYPGFLEKYPELLEALNSRKAGYFNRFPKSVVEKYEIDKIFNGIEKWCAEPQEETDFMVLTYTLQLIAAIHRCMRIEAPERQKIIVNKKNNAICDYIDHHYKENISIASIARSLFISPSYMSRMFSSEMGMTIKAYLSMRRVRSAKNLIMQGQSITNAYIESGFRDYSTFYRTFVKYAGMSPDEFKKSQTGQSSE